MIEHGDMRIKIAMIALLCASYVCASDVIVTKSAKKIDAKVLEVSSDVIKYKKVTNLGGPTYILKISEIQTIVYDNGEVETFKIKCQENKEEKSQKIVNKQRKPQESVVKYQPTPQQREHDELELRRMIYNRSNIGRIPNLNSAYSLRYFVNSFNYNQDGFLEYRKLDGVKLSNHQYAEYLRTRCRPAYDMYISGCNLASIGCCLTIMGDFLLLSGAICLASYTPVAYDDDSYDRELVKYAYGTAGTIVGSVCAIVGLPLWISGSVRKGRSIKIYNEECGGNDTAFEYRIGYTGKGVGLALNF